MRFFIYIHYCLYIKFHCLPSLFLTYPTESALCRNAAVAAAAVLAFVVAPVAAVAAAVTTTLPPLLFEETGFFVPRL
jgi:hypothetical protein